MVLGVQWLQSLGPTTFDYDKLTIQYQTQGKTVVLTGNNTQALPELKMIIGKSLVKQLKRQDYGMLVVVHPASAESLLRRAVTHERGEDKGDCHSTDATEEGIHHSMHGRYQNSLIYFRNLLTCIQKDPWITKYHLRQELHHSLIDHTDAPLNKIMRLRGSSWKFSRLG